MTNEKSKHSVVAYSQWCIRGIKLGSAGAGGEVIVPFTGQLIWTKVREEGKKMIEVKDDGWKEREKWNKYWKTDISKGHALTKEKDWKSQKQRQN